jgi:hypothetical protein
MVTSSTFGAGGFAGGAGVQATIVANGTSSHEPWRDLIEGIQKRL